MALSRVLVEVGLLRLELDARVGPERSAALLVALLGAAAPPGVGGIPGVAPTIAADRDETLVRALDVLVAPELVLRADADDGGVRTTLTAATAGDGVAWLRTSAHEDRVDLAVTAAGDLLDAFAAAVGLPGAGPAAARRPVPADPMQRSVLVQVAALRGATAVVTGDVVAWREDSDGTSQVDLMTGGLVPVVARELRQELAALVAAVLGASG